MERLNLPAVGCPVLLSATAAKQAKLLRSCIVRCIEDRGAILLIEDALELVVERDWDSDTAIWEYMVYRRDHLTAQLVGARESPASERQPGQLQVNSVVMLDC
jgi:hypothetical protein